MESLNMKPAEIETESFRIIDSEAGDHGRHEAEWSIVRRVIHTTADFEYARSMVFSEDAIEKGIAALRNGAPIVSDTNMARAGMNVARLAPLGSRISCFINDPDITVQSAFEGITRSVAAMRKAAAQSPDAIFVIGNAPTALFELLRLIKEGKAAPAMIIGLPVGFVGAEESKNALADITGVPYITNIGRKGGSNVAAAIINALAILATEKPL